MANNWSSSYSTLKKNKNINIDKKCEYIYYLHIYKCDYVHY